MGDPDGARSILEEVIEEGDESRASERAHAVAFDRLTRARIAGATPMPRIALGLEYDGTEYLRLAAPGCRRQRAVPARGGALRASPIIP